MRYLPLHIFSSLFDGVDLYSESGQRQIDQVLDSTSAAEIAQKAGYTGEEVTDLKNQLKSASVILFQNWIGQNKELEDLLTGNRYAVSDFVDKAGVLSHQYFGAFKSYVSPYLAERLIQLEVKDDNYRATLFTYCQLLDNDHVGVVEDQLFRPIKERLNMSGKELKLVEQEQDLIDIIQPLCGDEYLKIANSLSKSSYALKLLYVDTILSSIKSRACTARFANWVLKKMEQLGLNNEHKIKITEIRKDLREGKFEVKNKGIGKTPIRLRSIIPIVLILVIAFSAYYLIYFKPFSEVEEPIIEQSSSFTEFSKEERMKLDSLIQTMNSPLTPDEEGIDFTIPIINNTSLNVRKSFDNALLESIHSDLSKDASIQLNQVADSCQLVRKKFERYTGVEDLLKRNASVECVIKNESDYDAVLYVAENKNRGKVYSVYLKQNSTRTFKLNKGDILLTVGGNTYVPYVAPLNYNTVDVPSSKFNYHFCDTDINYEASINKAFEYVDNTRTKAKFMIMGRKGSYFELMDIYGVLSSY